jgi:hypothetical protein
MAILVIVVNTGMLLPFRRKYSETVYVIAKPATSDAANGIPRIIEMKGIEKPTMCISFLNSSFLIIE